MQTRRQVMHVRRQWIKLLEPGLNDVLFTRGA
jgi:hypothetical protein